MAYVRGILSNCLPTISHVYEKCFLCINSGERFPRKLCQVRIRRHMWPQKSFISSRSYPRGSFRFRQNKRLRADARYIDAALHARNRVHFLGAQRGSRCEQRRENKPRWLPAAPSVNLPLINLFVFLAKFPFRVSLKRARNGESAVHSGSTNVRNANVRALTVLGNQVEILSDYREPSGGNHFRKENAVARQRERL